MSETELLKNQVEYLQAEKQSLAQISNELMQSNLTLRTTNIILEGRLKTYQVKEESTKKLEIEPLDAA